MEGWPVFDEREPEPQPDLLEAFAGRQVTMFGLTATFGELADMCPVDLSKEPVETKNEFIIKAANEGRLEVEAQYESLFAQVLEAKGLERKFTVAPQAEALPDTRSQPARQETPVRERPQSPAAGAAQEPARPVSVEQPAAAPALQGMQLVRQVIAPAEVTAGGVPPMLPVLQTGRAAIAEALSLPSTDTPVAVGVSAAVLALTEQVFMTRIPQLQELNRTAVAEDLGTTAEQTPTPELPLALEAQTWATELHKDPPELLTDFIVALQEFGLILTYQQQGSIDAPESSHTNAAQVLEAPDVPSEALTPQVAIIFADLAKHLDHLAPFEQEQSTKLLQTIVGAVHGLKVLQLHPEALPPGALEATEVELRVMCEQLLQLAYMELAEEQIGEFVRLLTGPAFTQTLLQVSTARVEYDSSWEYLRIPASPQDYSEPSFSLLRLARWVLSQPVGA